MRYPKLWDNDVDQHWLDGTEEFFKGMREMRDEQVMTVLEDSNALLADGFGDALMGHTHGSNPVAVYDYEHCVNILIERDGMDCVSAIEFMEFNVVGAYVGEKSPVFISMR